MPSGLSSAGQPWAALRPAEPTTVMRLGRNGAARAADINPTPHPSNGRAAQER
jgi:hypothetical protein